MNWMECCIWCALCASFLYTRVVRNVSIFSWNFINSHLLHHVPNNRILLQFSIALKFLKSYWKIFSHKWKHFSVFLVFLCRNFPFLFFSHSLSFSFALFLCFIIFLQQEQLFRCVFCFYHFPEIFYSLFSQQNYWVKEEKKKEIFLFSVFLIFRQISSV